MPEKAKEEEQEKGAQPEQAETLPPPAAPKVKSEPTGPPAPDAVTEQEKVGADPEDPDAVRELDLIPEAKRGEGPRPEGAEEKKKTRAEKKAEKEELEEHTVEELKEIASEQNIDLEGATLKADIIKAIQKGRKKEE